MAKILTQKSIAHAVGLSPWALSNIINGYRKPSWTVAEQMAQHFGTILELWLDGSVAERRQSDTIKPASSKVAV